MTDLWYRKDAPRIAMIYGQNPRWDSSEAELLQASKFDLIITGSAYARLGGSTRAEMEKYNDNLKRLHEWNPRLKILGYFAGGMEFKRGTKYFDDDLFLKTTDGELVASWPGSYMLNLANPKTIQAFNDMVEDYWPRELAFDGVYFDTMDGDFTWAATQHQGKRDWAIDADEDGIRDSMDVLRQQWIEGKRQMLANFRATYGDEPYIMLNAGHLCDYARPYMDGNILENGTDDLFLSEDPSENTFNRIMQPYLDSCRTPSGRPSCTYINGCPGVPLDFNAGSTIPSAEGNRKLLRGYENLQRMRFGLAFALLGDGHYTYQLSGRWLGQHWWYQEYDIPIGKPQGSYFRHEDGTYRREYENAIVVLNNTCHDLEPHFEQTMRDGTTSWVGKDFLLPAKDGRIYVRVGL